MQVITPAWAWERVWERACGKARGKARGKACEMSRVNGLETGAGVIETNIARYVPVKATPDMCPSRTQASDEHRPI